jgi:hypothetical protein
VLLLRCAKPSDDAADGGGASSSKFLYVATGACYSGNGITSFNNVTSSNQIYRVNTTTGHKDITIADYYSSPSNVGDSPVSLIERDANSLLVLVENTTTATLRRVEIVEKKAHGSRSIYTNNTTALSAQLRRMRKLSDNFLLISRSTAAEKHRDGTNRLTVGANAWLTMSAPASSCTTSATLISDVLQLPSGLLVFAHAAAGNARLGVVSALGYSIAGDCRAAQTSPNANSFPTAMVYDDVNDKLIVAYGGSSTGADLNTIYAYSVNETTGVISSPQEIYDSNGFGSTYNFLLFGISSMALDPATNSLYVASAINTATTAVNYKIEKFNYNPGLIGVTNSAVLSPPLQVFFDYGFETRCISDMIVAP